MLPPSPSTRQQNHLIRATPLHQYVNSLIPAIISQHPIRSLPLGMCILKKKMSYIYTTKRFWQWSISIRNQDSDMYHKTAPSVV